MPSYQYRNFLCKDKIDLLMQKRRKSIANALELHFSCINPSRWHSHFIFITRMLRPRIKVFILLMKISSLAVPQVVKMPNSGPTSDEKISSKWQFHFSVSEMGSCWSVGVFYFRLLQVCMRSSSVDILSQHNQPPLSPHKLSDHHTKLHRKTTHQKFK